MTQSSKTGSKVSIRFVTQEQTFPAELGESILEVAERHGVSLDHACGGVCACSTCHVKILAGAECLSEATEDEEDQLDTARGLELTSRLGCQARIEHLPDAPVAIEVVIPAWNVNLVQEGS
jgi:2Fe-2S ferredoxin